jgi:hypothetical protein
MIFAFSKGRTTALEEKQKPGFLVPIMMRAAENEAFVVSGISCFF